MNNFRLPDNYYEPKEKLLWSQGCSDCGWVQDDPVEDFNDLVQIEFCPECKSQNIYTEQDYFQI